MVRLRIIIFVNDGPNTDKTFFLNDGMSTDK
jgi:hypothetical protein